MASGTGGAESDGGAGAGESEAESPALAAPTIAWNQRELRPARRRSESGAESLRPLRGAVWRGRELGLLWMPVRRFMRDNLSA